MTSPSIGDLDALTARAADLAAAFSGWTVDAVAELIAPDAAAALDREQRLPALLARYAAARPVGERRDIEAAVRANAMSQAEARGFDAPLVWAAGEGWHPGVVGIVASRLKEATNRPAIVIGLDGDEGKGSGRSVSGIDLGAAIHRLSQEGLLIKGGGHKMAAGLTVARDSLEPAMARLSELLARQGADKLGAADLKLDGLIMPRALSVEAIQQLEAAGPFGAAAPAPRFVLPDMQVRFSKRVGENHLKVSFGGDAAAMDAICFNAFDGPPMIIGSPRTMKSLTKKSRVIVLESSDAPVVLPLQYLLGS